MSDAQEFLKHLRNVHFAMVVTAGAILLGLTGTQTLYPSALDQLRDLSKLQSTLNPEHFSDALRRKFPAPSAPSGEGKRTSLDAFLGTAIQEFLEAIEIDASIERFSLSTGKFIYGEGVEDWPDEPTWLEEQLCFLSDGKTKYVRASSMPRGSRGVLEARIRQVDQLFATRTLYSRPVFESGYVRASDSVAAQTKEAVAALKPLDGAGGISLSARLKDVQLTDQASRDEYEECEQINTEDPIGYERFSGKFDIILLECTARYGADARNRKRLSVTLPLPVMFSVEEHDFLVSAVEKLATSDEVFPRFLSGARTCAELFPELTEVTRHLQSTAYDDLERHLLEQVQKNTAPINVLGVQIETHLIELWGVLALLCVQFYFCAHYQSFLVSCGERSATVFPWIGMYRSPAAVVMFHASLSLPLVVCAFVILKSGIGTWGFRLLFVGVAALMMAWTARTFVRHGRVLRGGDLPQRSGEAAEATENSR